MILLPRIERHEVDVLRAELVRLGAKPGQASGIVEGLGLRPHWNRSGGMPASPEQRTLIGSKLRHLAEEYGFPEAPDLAGQQAFDRAACRILSDDPMLRDAFGETMRPACWAGLVCFDVLDLAIWRHGGEGKEISVHRLLGRERNFLRRLWLRTNSLTLDTSTGGDPWALIDMLTEDAVVQIIERPSIAADRRLAVAIGRGWREASRRTKRMEDVMRIATKRLRAMAEVRALSVLPDEELQGLVNEAFSLATAHVKSEEEEDDGQDMAIHLDSENEPRRGTFSFRNPLRRR